MDPPISCIDKFQDILYRGLQMIATASDAYPLCEESKLNALRLTVGPIFTRRNNLRKKKDYLQVRSISNPY